MDGQHHSNANQMTPIERRVVAFTGVAHGLNHAVELVYGAVLVVVAIEFDVSVAALGLLGTAASISYAVAALPAGATADRLGSQRTVALSMAGAGAAAALAAVAPNVTILGVALVLMGLLGGMYHPAGLSFISRSVRQRARALGVHGAAGNLGTALAPLVAGVLAGIWSWRGAFLVFAVLSLTISVLASRSSIGAESQGQDVPKPHLRATTLLLPLALMFVINACFGFIFRGLTLFLPLHLGTNLGFDIFGFEPVVVGGAVATVALLFGVAGQYIGGELGERFPRERVVVPVAALTVPSLLLMAMGHGWVLLVGAILFVFFNFMAQPTSVAMISDYAAERLQGRVYGLTSLSGFGVGSLAGVAGGFISDGVGVEWVFAMLAGVASITVISGMVINAYLFFGRGHATITERD
jgi:MFS family permease